MTREEAWKLTQGKVLTWKKRPPNDRNPILYPAERWADTEGNTVVFVSFYKGSKPKFQTDMYDFPLVVVKAKGKRGDQVYSSEHFE